MHWKVLSAARRDSQVFSKDRRPFVWRHQHEVNAATTPVSNDRLTMCRFDILYPIRLHTEHRYEVVFAVDGGEHYGIRAYTAGFASSNFKDSLELRRQAKTRPPAVEAIKPSAETRGTPVTVEQPHECATLRRVRLS